MVDLHAHLPQLPNAGLGFALDLLTWLDRATSSRSSAPSPIPRSPSGSPRRSSRRSPPPARRRSLAYGAVYEASLDAAFRAAEAHGIRAILGKVMMDRGDVRPDDRAVDDPRPVAARVGRPHRALARRRRRPARLRGHAAVRGLVHGRHAARVGGARAVAPGRSGRPTCPRTRRDRRGRAGCSPRRSTTSTSTTGPAGSASGRSSPTRSTCPIASSAGSSRPGRASRTARPRTCSSAPGSCRSARYLEAGLSVGLGIGRRRRPGPLDLLGHARRGLRPEGAPQRWPATRAPSSSRSTGSGWRRSTARGARARTTSSARSRPARRPT